MSLVSASELAGLKVIAESGMTSRATIQKRATAQTVNGQQSGWTTSATNVPCWVYQATPLGGTLGNIAGAVGISQTFSIRFAVGTDVNSGDHVIVGAVTYLVEQDNSESTISPWLVCGARALE